MSLLRNYWEDAVVEEAIFLAFPALMALEKDVFLPLPIIV
jgi:hypothetical protein